MSLNQVLEVVDVFSFLYDVGSFPKNLLFDKKREKEQYFFFLTDRDKSVGSIISCVVSILLMV